MIRIRSDESLFIVSKETIQKYPESDLYKIINENSTYHPYIHKDDKDGNITLYIDSDPDVMKLIIKMMRGGKIDVNLYSDPDLLKSTSNMLKMPFFKDSTIISSNVEIGDDSDLKIGGNHEREFSRLEGNHEREFSRLEGNHEREFSRLGESDNLANIQNKIEQMLVTNQKKQLSDELTEFSSDVVKSLDASINKKHGRRLKARLFALSDE